MEPEINGNHFKLEGCIIDGALISILRLPRKKMVECGYLQNMKRDIP